MMYDVWRNFLILTPYKNKEKRKVFRMPVKATEIA